MDNISLEYRLYIYTIISLYLYYFRHIRINKNTVYINKQYKLNNTNTLNIRYI